MELQSINDLLGRVIEVISGQTFDQYIEERIFKPLSMKDSGFWVKPENQNRVAQPPRPNGIKLFDVAKPPKLLSGGAGMVGTTMDYARFAQMLLNGGQIDGVRVVGPKDRRLHDIRSFGINTRFHVPRLWLRARLWGPHDPRNRLCGRFRRGILLGWVSPVRSFWVDPKEDMFVVFMINDMTIGPSCYHCTLIPDLVYQALMK